MLTITPLPAFESNYFWLMTFTGSTQAYIVDPGNEQVVERALDERGLNLAGILITHQHWDHVNGVNALVARYQSAKHPIPVYGPNSKDIPQITHHLHHQDKLTLFERYTFTVFACPGHTPEHIAYFSDNRLAETVHHAPILFCGDTLFAGGCGRLLGGTAQQLYNSLQQLSQLPDDTQIYCAHEYTLSNLHFALAVEPGNTDIATRIQLEQQKRDLNQPTLPSSIEVEKQTNPFLRSHIPDVQRATEAHWATCYTDPSEVFTDLRRWKDQF